MSSLRSHRKAPDIVVYFPEERSHWLVHRDQVVDREFGAPTENIECGKVYTVLVKGSKGDRYYPGTVLCQSYPQNALHCASHIDYLLTEYSDMHPTCKVVTSYSEVCPTHSFISPTKTITEAIRATMVVADDLNMPITPPKQQKRSLSNFKSSRTKQSASTSSAAVSLSTKSKPASFCGVRASNDPNTMMSDVLNLHNVKYLTGSPRITNTKQADALIEGDGTRPIPGQGRGLYLQHDGKIVQKLAHHIVSKHNDDTDNLDAAINNSSGPRTDNESDVVNVKAVPVICRCCHAVVVDSHQSHPPIRNNYHQTQCSITNQGHQVLLRQSGQSRLKRKCKIAPLYIDPYVCDDESEPSEQGCRSVTRGNTNIAWRNAIPFHAEDPE